MDENSKPSQDLGQAAPSPTGTVVGLSALIASLPPWAMNLALSVISLAVAVESIAAADSALLPATLVRVAHVVVVLAVPAALASPGVRK